MKSIKILVKLVSEKTARKGLGLSADHIVFLVFVVNLCAGIFMFYKVTGDNGDSSSYPCTNCASYMLDNIEGSQDVVERDPDMPCCVLSAQRLSALLIVKFRRHACAVTRGHCADDRHVTLF